MVCTLIVFCNSVSEVEQMDLSVERRFAPRQFQFWREEVLPPPALYDFSFTALARHSPLLLTTIRHHTVINTQFSS